MDVDSSSSQNGKVDTNTVWLSFSLVKTASVQEWNENQWLYVQTAHAENSHSAVSFVSMRSAISTSVKWGGVKGRGGSDQAAVCHVHLTGFH